MSMMQAMNAQGLGIMHYPVNATNAVTGLLKAAAKMMSAETLELSNCNSDLESSDDEVKFLFTERVCVSSSIFSLGELLSCMLVNCLC